MQRASCILELGTSRSTRGAADDCFRPLSSHSFMVLHDAKKEAKIHYPPGNLLEFVFEIDLLRGLIKTLMLQAEKMMGGGGQTLTRGDNSGTYGMYIPTVCTDVCHLTARSKPPFSATIHQFNVLCSAARNYYLHMYCNSFQMKQCGRIPLFHVKKTSNM